MARVVSFIPCNPPGVALSDAPTIKGKAGAVAWYRDVLGIPVSMNNVVVATNNRMLPSYLIGGAVFYSTPLMPGHCERFGRALLARRRQVRPLTRREAPSGASTGTQVSAAIAFVVGMLAVVEITLAGYLVTPAKTQAFVQLLHDWARAHRRKVLVAMFAVVGVALVAQGMR